MYSSQNLQSDRDIFEFNEKDEEHHLEENVKIPLPKRIRCCNNFPPNSSDFRDPINYTILQQAGEPPPQHHTPDLIDILEISHQNQQQIPVVYINSEDCISLSEKFLRVTNRARMVDSLIKAYGLLDHTRTLDGGAATNEDLLAFHSSDYIDYLVSVDAKEDNSPETYETAQEYGLAYDCPINADIFQYVTLVAGASLQAAQCLLEGKCKIAINWMGGWHHAKRDSASGFCYVNDVVLSILRLQTQFQRILYVDIDLHHCDGVEDAFVHTAKVLTVSFHKFSEGFFPGTGSLSDVGIGKGQYSTVNVPLKDGIDDKIYCALFKRVMDRVFAVYQPQAVVLQCGADTLVDDPMATFNLTPQGIGRCLQLVLDQHLPTLLLGGGGYHAANTARCWSYLTAMAVGKQIASDIPEHQYLLEYGPDYSLEISRGNRKNCNDDKYLQTLEEMLLGNLEQLRKCL